jgi:hypothetical protein
MKKSDIVVYIDAKSQEHPALVTAVNAFNPGFISLAYIDLVADERENVVQVLDVPHIKQENNPDLRSIHLNAWRASYEND